MELVGNDGTRQDKDAHDNVACSAGTASRSQELHDQAIEWTSASSSWGLTASIRSRGVCMLAVALVVLVLSFNVSGEDPQQPSALSSTSLFLSPKIARDLEMARRSSESNEGVRRRIDDEVKNSEEWGKRKLRDMVARLFRAITAMDEKVSRENKSLKQEVSSVRAQGYTKQEVKELIRSTQKEVEGRMLDASKELNTVIAGENNIRNIINGQESLDDKQHSHVLTEVERMEAKEKLLAEEIAGVKDRERKWIMQKGAGEAKLSAKEAGASSKEMMLVLTGLGVQDKMDRWCNEGERDEDATSAETFADSKCGREEQEQEQEQEQEENDWARRFAAGNNDDSYKWRCYAPASLTPDLVCGRGKGRRGEKLTARQASYSKGTDYCTKDKELQAEMEQVNEVEGESGRRRSGALAAVSAQDVREEKLPAVAPVFALATRLTSFFFQGCRQPAEEI
eukprot:764208-Hanusia_phi.AAC.4